MKKKVQPGRERVQTETAMPTWTAAITAPPSPAGRAAGRPAAERGVQTIAASTTERKRLRVAGYCRTSTDFLCQRTSIENQRTHYRREIEGNPDWDLVDIYWETGLSGTRAETRPELQRLISDCKAGLIDLVITKSISRFSRNTSDLLYMVRSLTNLGVAIRFEKEQLQTDTMGTEFLLTVLAAFSQDESRSISTNMKWGIRKRFEAGTYRPSRAPYGYRKNPKPTDCGRNRPTTEIYTIEPAEAEIVRRIFYACINGKGSGIIARELNEEGIPTWTEANDAKQTQWSAKGVLNILHNVFYTGDALYQQTYMDETYKQRKNKGELDQYLNEDAHPAIIDRETFEKAAAMIGRLREQYGKGNRAVRYCFSGKIICGRCGEKMYHGGTKRHLFLCYGHSHRRTCSMKPMYEDELQNAFTTMLNKLIFAEAHGVTVFCPQNNAEDCREIEAGIDETQRVKSLPCDRALADRFTAKFRKKGAALEAEEQELPERRAHTLREDTSMRDFVRKREIGTIFDSEAFGSFVEKAVLWTGEKIEFHLTCGIVLTENLAPTIPTSDEQSRETAGDATERSA